MSKGTFVLYPDLTDSFLKARYSQTVQLNTGPLEKLQLQQSLLRLDKGHLENPNFLLLISEISPYQLANKIYLGILLPKINKLSEELELFLLGDSSRL